jgi:hypothetical protein
MNVNNIMNLYCRTAERGYAKKETMMAAERWWKEPGKVMLTSTENQYRIWTSLAQRTKSGSLAPNLMSHRLVGRWLLRN